MIICEEGTTERTKDFIKQNLSRIGNVISVKHKADHNGVKYETFIEGEKDTIKVNGGLASGYGGEGPNGLKNILTELGMPGDQAGRYSRSKGGFKHIF